MRESRGSDRRRGRARAFTLIELVMVMMLLGIAAALVVPHMASFVRGRALASEARRMLALTRYGQSRAIAEGVPVLLWVDAGHAKYGLTVQGDTSGTDAHAPQYTLDPVLSIEAVAPDPVPASEDQDERLGVPDNLPSIRFMPGGYFDDASIAKIVIREGSEGALQLAPTENRLAYEIQPASP